MGTLCVPQLVLQLATGCYRKFKKLKAVASRYQQYGTPKPPRDKKTTLNILAHHSGVMLEVNFRFLGGLAMTGLMASNTAATGDLLEKTVWHLTGYLRVLVCLERSARIRLVGSVERTGFVGSSMRWGWDQRGSGR